MKNKSRFLLPILTFLTFGMVTGSVVVTDYSIRETKESSAHSLNSGAVYYVDNHGWNSIYVHAWHNDGSKDVPEHIWGEDVKMTDTGCTFHGVKIWKYTFESSLTTHVIFKNAPGDTSWKTGNEALQTGDMCLYDAFNDGSFKGTWRAYTDGLNPDTTEREIICRKPTSWTGWKEDLYLYSYYNNSNKNTDWPGYKMDYMGAWGGYYYYHSYTKYEYINCIFNDKYGDPAGNNQIEVQDTGINFYTDNVLYDLDTRTVMKFDIEYSRDNSNWEILDRERNNDFLGKYYTHASVNNQVQGEKIYMRFSIGKGASYVTVGVDYVETQENMNANNLANDADGRPTFKYNGPSGFIEFYWSKENYKFYVKAKGIDSDKMNLVVKRNGSATFYETTYDGSYSYGSYYGRWYKQIDNMQVGDEVYFLDCTNSHGGTGNEYKADWLTGETTGFTKDTSDGNKIKCTIATNYILYLEKDQSESHNVTVMSIDRLTRRVTFDVNGHGSISPSVVTVNKNTPVSKPSDPSSVPYYTLTSGKWYTDSRCYDEDEYNFSTNVSSDITLYAKWTPIEYDINYTLNGGTNDEDNPSSYNIETPTITLEDPTRTGYTFSGWYSNSSFSGDPVTSIPLGSHGEKNLYAKWTINQYSLSWGTVSGDVMVGSYTAAGSHDYGTTITYPDKVLRAGYKQSGWSSSPTTLPASNTTLTPTFSAVTGITKSFIAGATFGIRYMIPSTYTYGSENNKDFNYVEVTAPNPNLSYIDNVTYQAQVSADNSGNHYVSIPVNSAHLSASVTISLKFVTEDNRNGFVLWTDTTNIKDASSSIAGSGTFDEETKSNANILKASLTYGAYSQLYFGTNVSSLANSAITSEDKALILTAMNNTAIAEDELEISKDGTPSFGFSGIAFSSQEGFVIRIVLNLKGASNCDHLQVSLDAGAGTGARFAYDDIHNYWTVEVRGISAEDIFTKSVVTVSDKVGGGSRTLEYAVGTYLYSVTQDPKYSSDTALLNLCKAVNLLGTVANATPEE